MSTTADQNEAQARYWNDDAGHVWTTWQERMDGQLAPLGLAALDAAGIQPGLRVLDIGCGCGHTTLEAAHRVGPSGSVVGLDVSDTMLMRARERATADGVAQRVEFVCGDAQVAAVADVGGPADVVVSRFGVMFFADPTAAFANIGSLARSGATMAFVCWQAPKLNLWASEMGRELARMFPDQPPVDPHAPGPFAFADPDRTAGLVSAGGWTHVQVASCVRPMQLFGTTDRNTALEGILLIGGAGRLLKDATDMQRDEARMAATRVIDGFWTDNGAVVDGACWLVTAQCV